jgi:hypothetical protein
VSPVQSWIARAAVVVVVPPKRRAARLTALAGMIAEPRWLDAVTSPTSNPFLAVFSTGAGELVRVMSGKPRLTELEFAVELGLYGMFCSPHQHA